VSELPTPKYKIGDTVFFPSYTSTVEQLPCPDCLGSRQWPVTTPAGQEIVLECPRCCGYSAALPRLTKYVPLVTQLTIGQINATTYRKGYDSANGVEYMCSETGTGSGSVYQELQLFTDKERADQAALLKITEAQERYDKQEAVQKATKYAHLKIADAEKKKLEEDLWSANYDLDKLRDDLFELIEGKASEWRAHSFDFDMVFNYNKSIKDEWETKKEEIGW
jgi:hypothetical protein